MQRREAIRNILLASASTIFITSCSEVNVIELLKGGKLMLNSNHENYLKKISETFLPTNDLRGKIASPVDFIMTMINDCHSPEEVNKFATGFESYKILMDESRIKINPTNTEQVIPVVEQVLAQREQPKEDLQFFINKVKGLSIKHLMSSEYFLTTQRNFSLIPKDTFDGYADVK